MGPSTGSGFAASRGPDQRVAYEASDSWEIGLEARYEEFEFRLADDNDAPGGTGIDRSIPVVLTSRWSPSESITLSGFVGAAFGGQFTLEDEKGHEVSRSTYDPAPIFDVPAGFEF
jgi:hypothetical protein